MNRRQVSCGAILVAMNPDGVPGVILGRERWSEEYFPFKGCIEGNETPVQAAKREIYEETVGLVSVDNIELGHRFATKSKKYHIGAALVDYAFIELFQKAYVAELAGSKRNSFLEKTCVKFFPLSDALNDPSVHNLTKKSVSFYASAILDLVVPQT